MSDYILPPPADHQKLERIVCDALEVHWGLRDTQGMLQMEGPGSGPQGGIDLFGCDNKGRMTVIQVKKREDSLSVADMRHDLDEFARYSKKNSNLSSIHCFYFATTAKNERELTHAVQALSKEFGFSIDIIYWKSICGWLREEPGLIAKHFPDYSLPRLVTRTQAVESALPAFQAGYLLRSIESEFYHVKERTLADISLPLANLGNALRRLLSREISKECCRKVQILWETSKRQQDTGRTEDLVHAYQRWAAMLIAEKIEDTFDGNLLGRRSFDLGSTLGHFSACFDRHPDELKTGRPLLMPANVVEMVNNYLPDIPRAEILHWVQGYVSHGILHSHFANVDFGQIIYLNIESRLLWLNDTTLNRLI